MKANNGIEGYDNRVKIAPRKIKLPNLVVLDYIKVGKYHEAEVANYLYTVREGKSREGR